MSRWMIIAGILGLIAVLGVFRLIPAKTFGSYLDPFDVTIGKRPNQYLTTTQEGEFDLPASELVAKLRKEIDKTPRTRRFRRKYYPLSSDQFFGVTYVTRSLFMGFPDFTSIKVLRTSETTSQVMIYGRAGFGYSDFGVNEQRIKGWLATLREEV